MSHPVRRRYVQTDRDIRLRCVERPHARCVISPLDGRPWPGGSERRLGPEATGVSGFRRQAGRASRQTPPAAPGFRPSV